ncbi:hypothetical protein NFI96_003817 [Prochilodus magdalenae]|nr:hypothetical protein NFI96_003817 [Prochilodus magdalenae]
MGYQNTEVSLEEQSSEVFRTLDYLSSVIANIRTPMGTRENPARFCKDLLDCQHDMADGMFWIDPNLGCTSDAIQVFCNFTAGGQTCIHPLSTDKVALGVSKVQMKFLHLLSISATQTVTFHCYNDPASANAAAPRSVRFQGWNGQVFEENSPLQPHVLQDDCQVRDGRWQQSRFLLLAQDSAQLPVTNVHDLPPEQADDQRHLEVGPVCFL